MSLGAVACDWLLRACLGLPILVRRRPSQVRVRPPCAAPAAPGRLLSAGHCTFQPQAASWPLPLRARVPGNRHQQRRPRSRWAIRRRRLPAAHAVVTHDSAHTNSIASARNRCRPAASTSSPYVIPRLPAACWTLRRKSIQGKHLSDIQHTIQTRQTRSLIAGPGSFGWRRNHEAAPPPSAPPVEDKGCHRGHASQTSSPQYRPSKTETEGTHHA